MPAAFRLAHRSAPEYSRKISELPERDCHNSRRLAQFVHAQPEEQRHQDRVAGHFAAYPTPVARVLRSIDGLLDEADDGGMRRVVEVGNFLVLRSTASEYWMRSFVPMLKNLEFRASVSATITADGISHHDADFHVFVEGNLGCTQFGFALLQQCIRARKSSSPNHRVHHFNVTGSAGAQNCP